MYHSLYNISYNISLYDRLYYPYYLYYHRNLTMFTLDAHRESGVVSAPLKRIETMRHETIVPLDIVDGITPTDQTNPPRTIGDTLDVGRVQLMRTRSRLSQNGAATEK